MIQVKELTKKYGNKSVVEDVTVDIQPGMITSFIGPNGAGKSTLLSMVSRLLIADTGEVLLDKADVRRWKSDEFAKRVSILKQSNYMNVRLTIRELVAFGRFPYTKGRLNDEDNVKVDEALAYMNLEDLQHNFLDELSGGQRQRAFIAMVIAQD
ncbi:MAG TPA: ATP-binding cassette domain-containing protein, partial [Metalysinibacillus sp.]